MRFCKCGVLTKSARHWYCEACGKVAAAARRRSRSARTHAGTTTERGYGGEHAKVRRRWEGQVATGRVRCWRCHRYIDPREPWDLGHDDVDRSVYRGPEHQACNRATSTHQRDLRARRATVRRQSEAWF